MAEEERERNRARRDERGPPQVANSRFAAAAEADRSNFDRNDDRGPPPVANSRFAAAAEADRSFDRSYDRNDRGPPPVANSRFAAAAEADRSYDRPDMDRSFNREPMGPPPVANSRFAAAAEADRSFDGPAYGRDNRGPPPVANSRFAAAAEADRSYDRPDRGYDRQDRPSYNDNRGPPPIANSRFAAAAAQAEEENREYQERRRERYDGGGGGRYDGGGGRYDDRGGYRRRVEAPEPELPTRVDELLKPKKPSSETVLDPQSKEHEANMFQFPAKALKKEDEDFLSSGKKETEPSPVAADAPETPAEPVVSIASVSAGTSEEMLNKFISGDKLGDDLKAWCEEIRPTLPTVEKMVFHLLTEKEKLNPDPDCAWADPAQYGAALLSLVEDNVFNQMQVLWAIQLYCDGLGFPKFNDESVVQSMFRAMYKYDLAEAEAFEEWKEDESEVHEAGKMTTIIQTMDWFNWLDEDDDDEDEEEEE